MRNKRGQGDSSPVAIFAIIVVVLIAIFAFVAYSQGYFPFREHTTTVVVEDNQPDNVYVEDNDPDPIFVDDDEPDTVIINNNPTPGENTT